MSQIPQELRNAASLITESSTTSKELKAAINIAIALRQPYCVEILIGPEGSEKEYEIKRQLNVKPRTLTEHNVSETDKQIAAAFVAQRQLEKKALEKTQLPVVPNNFTDSLIKQRQQMAMQSNKLQQ